MQRHIIEVPVISEFIRKLGAPTSALVRAGDMLYTCGMPPIDWRTGEIVRGDISTQTKAALDALAFTLDFAGSSLDRAVKTLVFVADTSMMGDLNAVYRQYFTDGFPARTCVAINTWPLFDVEIECIAPAS